MSSIEVIAAGNVYSNWDRVRVLRSIAAIAHTFEVTAIDTVGEVGKGLRPLKPGVSVQIKIDGEQVMNGYVDDRVPDYDGNDFKVTISGRNKTGDLVDCSAIHKSGEFKKRNLQKIADDLCSAFGIKVVAETAVGASFDRFALNESESVFQALQRAASQRGVFLTSNKDGDLVITKAGTTRVSTRLVLGENIIKVSGRDSWAQRFSEYTVKGQSGATTLSATSTKPVEQTAIDAVIARYRPTIAMSVAETDLGRLKKYANWQRNIGLGQSQRFNVTVSDWSNDDGLWTENTIVTLRDPFFLGVDQEFLIESVEYIINDEDGIVTRLSLVPPEAFDVEAVPAAVVEAGLF